MIVCTVLNVKPYSGLYPACNNCMGKVLQHQGNKWWCRKCDYVTSDIQQRYCIAMTITDHSTSPQNVLMFGQTCDPIFGCSATNLARCCLKTVQSESIRQALYEAIESTLVGNYFGFVFCLPPLMKKESSLLSITKTFQEFHKKRDLVVTIFKMLYNNSDTVLSKLGLTLTNRHQMPQLTNTERSQQDDAVVHSDDSDFFTSALSQPSPSQGILLETYLESQESLSVCVTATPNSFTQQSVGVRTPLLLSNTFLDLLTPTQRPLECTTTLNVPNAEYPSPQTQPPSIKTKSVCHGKIGLSQEAIQDYLSELSRTKWLVKELESDWECTQQNSCPDTSFGTTSSEYNSISLSEDTLRELHEPFSQSRQTTPNSAHTRLNTASSQCTQSQPPNAAHTLLNTASSQCTQSQPPNADMSPELFSSVRSTRTLIGADSNQRLLSYTPSQLLQCARRDNTSPELFESLPREEQQRVYCLKTPAIAAAHRDRTHALRRKLVQDTTNVTPSTVNSSISAYYNAFSPDIV